MKLGASLLRAWRYCFDTGCCYVAQAGHKFLVLLQFPKCWKYAAMLGCKCIWTYNHCIFLIESLDRNMVTLFKKSHFEALKHSADF